MGIQEYWARPFTLLCVLCIIEQRQPIHGYVIIGQINEMLNRETSGAIVYPLLRDMQRSGLLSVAWRDVSAGPARKEYRLTQEGRAHLKALRSNWREFTASIEQLVYPTAE